MYPHHTCTPDMRGSDMILYEQLLIINWYIFLEMIYLLTGSLVTGTRITHVSVERTTVAS